MFSLKAKKRFLHNPGKIVKIHKDIIILFFKDACLYSKNLERFYEDLNEEWEEYCELGVVLKHFKPNKFFTKEQIESCVNIAYFNEKTKELKGSEIGIIKILDLKNNKKISYLLPNDDFFYAYFKEVEEC